MKLILESIGDAMFAYRESERHFKKVQPQRGSKQIDPSQLDLDCRLESGHWHMVFDLKDGTVKRAKLPKKKGR